VVQPVTAAPLLELLEPPLELLLLELLPEPLLPPSRLVPQAASCITPHSVSVRTVLFGVSPVRMLLLLAGSPLRGTAVLVGIAAYRRGNPSCQREM
jgi:hypothetical protein